MSADPKFYKQIFAKPDGRDITLYSHATISNVGEIPSPQAKPLTETPHLRWNSLRGEWVSFAPYRQNRTFLPPPEYNPLQPTQSKDYPTELPQGDYDVAVFDNLFPALALSAQTQGVSEVSPEEFAVANGKCEVVVFSQDPEGSLGTQSTERIDLILHVWADRTLEISKNKHIKYVMPFENRGVEMGVTLNHPHGQIYAYPFVPPIAQKEIENQKIFFEKNTGRGLLANMVEEEIHFKKRIVCETESSIAFIPRGARYPYEVWLMPRRPVQHLHQLDSASRRNLAVNLKTLLLKFDRLWNKSFPYLMVLHQAPVNSGECPWVHLHFEFFPPLRSPQRLKYLAGTELGAGLFANDCLPEEKAKELRDA